MMLTKTSARDIAGKIVGLESQLSGLRQQAEDAEARMVDLRLRGAEDPRELRDSKLTFEEAKLGLQAAEHKLADLRPALLLAAEAERIQRLAELFDAHRQARVDKAALDDEIFAAAGRFLASLVPLFARERWERAERGGLLLLADLEALKREHLPAFRAPGNVLKNLDDLGGTAFEEGLRAGLEEKGFERATVPSTPGVRESDIEAEQRELGHMDGGGFARLLLDKARKEIEAKTPALS